MTKLGYEQILIFHREIGKNIEKVASAVTPEAKLEALRKLEAYRLMFGTAITRYGMELNHEIISSVHEPVSPP